MEAGQGDELEFVAHGAQLALELRRRLDPHLALPVEAGRAVVGQHLAGEVAVDRLGEGAGIVEVGVGGLPPQQVGIGRIGQAAGDGVLLAAAGADAVEALRRAVVADEGPVALVHVAGEELRALGIRPAQQHGRHALDVGGEAGGVQGADVLADRHQHLAAEMAALLLGGQLVLEVHARGAGIDHRPHQLIGVERAAEAGLGVGHDRRHVVRRVVLAAFLHRDLVGPAQRVVDAADHLGDAVDRIERLVRVHGAGGIGVRRHLPADEVDRLQPGLDLLQRLHAGQRAERRHLRLGLQQLPQPPGAAVGQGMGDRGSCRRGGRHPRACSRGGCRRSGRARAGRRHRLPSGAWVGVGVGAHRNPPVPVGVE